MSAKRRNVLFEIAGVATGFVAAGTTGAASAASWATTFVEAVASIPASQGASVNPYDGTFDTPGSSITMTTIAAYLMQRSTSNYTTLATGLGKGDLTMTVDDTSAFASSGTLYVGDEAITYSGKTSTTFTGLTRGAYGTTAQAWTSELDEKTGELRRVHDYNPFFEGRLCQVTWFDPDDPINTKTRRFSGFVSNPRFGGEGWTIDIVNGKKLLEDAEVMGGVFAKGTLAGAYAYKGSGLEPFGKITLDGKAHGAFEILLSDPDVAFPSISSTDPKYLLIGEEIWSYGRTTTPSHTGTAVAVGSGTFGNYFESNESFRKGDYIAYTNSSTLHEAIITREATGSGATYRYYHTNSTNPSVSATVYTPGRQRCGLVHRALFGSRKAEHDSGAEVRELRVLRGDHVDTILKLLLSTGTGDNGSWDVLPEGWGAGIPQALVDTAAFRKIRDYSDVREFKFDGPVRVNELLATLGRVTASRIFFNRQGQLTVNAERDVWPDSAAQMTIDIDNIKSDALPNWSAALSRIYNSWVIRGYSPRGSELLEVVHFEDYESRQRYGQRSLPDLEDPGLIINRNLAKIELIGRSVLHRFARPCPLLELTLYFAEGNTIEPGHLVLVTLAHLPTLTGGAGLSSSLFEVLEVFPQDANGAIDVVLLQMPAAGDTRLIAPACEVESVSSSDITVKAASSTYYADPSGHDSSIYPLSDNGQDGSEDLHYFNLGDQVQILDASSFGGTASKFSTTISAIDYATLTMTLTALPGWTIAAGDIVTLDTYANTKATNPESLEEYAWLASGTPPLLGADAPHVWGM